jgi:hypothetical protein
MICRTAPGGRGQGGVDPAAEEERAEDVTPQNFKFWNMTKIH